MTSELLTSEDVQAIYVRAYRDPVFFCKFFLEDLFPKDIPWVHRGLWAILTKRTDFLWDYGEVEKIERNFVYKGEDGTEHRIFHVNYVKRQINLVLGKNTLVVMPRGFSKTTLVGTASVLYKILFQEAKFPVYLSETATAAEAQLGNVKSQLESNERIHMIFGNLRPEQRSGKKWSEGFIQTTTGVTVLARGRGGQVRGMNVDGQRPDLILFDDVEDTESVKTEEQRLKTKTWLFRDVMPALPRMDPDAGIIGVGTILHREALIPQLLDDPNWTVVVFGAIDLDGDALWSENMTLEQIEALKESYARQGMLDGFYMEYMSQITAPEKQKFKPHYIHISPIVDWRTEVPHRAIFIDPAISEKRRADYASIVVAGMTKRGVIQVLDIWADKGQSPRDLVDKYFEMVFTWDPQKYGVETISYQAALAHLLREEMFRKHRYFELTQVPHHSERKDHRIEGILQPRFASGYVHWQRDFPLLRAQLLDFPNGKKDCPDVLAMCVALLDPYAAQAADPSKDLGDDEYEPLPRGFGHQCP